MMDHESLLIAGVDEAGRGPLAGPVVAAAVIFDPKYPIDDLKDSKQLTAKQRELFAEKIKKNALAWGVGVASVLEIDKLNILQATLLAMQRAVAALNRIPDRVLVDGNQSPKWSYTTKTIIQGDASVPVISAASIIAKVYRDNEMLVWHEKFPQYGFSQHKGYGTKQHIQALRTHGPCEIHRQSFAPVRDIYLTECSLDEA